MLISAHISNRFVIVCNIQIVIRMLYHSFETLLFLSFFYLTVKSGKPFVKIEFHFQIAFFQTPEPPIPQLSPTPPPAVFLILPNVLTLPLIRTPQSNWDPSVIKKYTLAQVFYCKFCEIFKNTSGRLLLNDCQIFCH